MCGAATVFVKKVRVDACRRGTIEVSRALCGWCATCACKHCVYVGALLGVWDFTRCVLFHGLRPFCCCCCVVVGGVGVVCENCIVDASIFILVCFLCCVCCLRAYGGCLGMLSR